jgi:copper transporter 1
MHMAMGHGDMGHGGMGHGDMDMGGQCKMNVRFCLLALLWL